MKKISKVRLYLIKHGSITSWQAITYFRATRLADMIFRLRRQGWDISTEMVKTDDGSTYAKYHFHPRA